MSDDYLSNLPTEHWNAVHEVIERFEEAWENDERPNVAEFLPAASDLRPAAMRALLQIDFERRMKSGERQSVEAYIEQLPELTESPELLLDLIASDFQQRRRDEPDLDGADYVEQFPDLSEQISARLSELDPRNQATEAWTTGHGDTWQARPPLTKDRNIALPELPGYEVLALIASGGMGSVFKARDTKLDRFVALKVPRPEFTVNEEGRERFLREARSAAKLRHANLCPIYEIGDAGSQPYIAMGFIQGSTLREKAKADKLTGREAAEVIAKLARAVDFAHKQGVIHRDIKPANVLLDEETGEPILTDFGLAKLSTDADVHMTQTGQVMGTPAYMAPEQAAGDVATMGPATDVYALGALLYDLLCGRPPFEGNISEIFTRLQNEEPTTPRRVVPQLHRDLETICLKALSKRPEDRYDSAAALAEDLERFSAGESILARPQSLASKVWRRVLKNPSSVAVASCVLVVAIAAAWIGSSARTDRQVTSLTADVTTALESDDWSASQVAKIESNLSKLEELDPIRATQLDRRLNEQLRDSIQTELQHRMTEARAADVRDRLAILESRDPVAADTLDTRFEHWLRDWTVAFELRAPFSELPSVFPSGVTVDDERLVSTFATSPTEAFQFVDPLVETTVPCRDDIEIEATFDASWKSAHEVGVVLNSSGNDRYEFIVRVQQAAPVEPIDEQREEQQPRTFVTMAQAIKQRSSLLSEIWRNGSPLYRRELPATQFQPDGSGELVIRARRIRDELQLQVNTNEPIAFFDPFPLPENQQSVFALRWSPSVHVRSITARTRRSATQPSGLESADVLYDQRQFGKALSVYQREASRLSEATGKQEAVYKQGRCLVELKRDDDAIECFQTVASQSGDRWPALASVQAWLIYLKRKDGKAASDVLELLSNRFSFEQLAAVLPTEARDQILNEYTSYLRSISLRSSYDPERLSRMEQAARVDKVMSYDGHGSKQIQFELCRAYRLAGDFEQALAVAGKLCKRSPSSSPAHRMKFRTLRLLGRNDQALKEINRFLEDNSDNESIQRNFLCDRARTHYHLGDLDAALADLRYVERQYGFKGDEATLARLMYGLLLYQRGFESEALDVWRDSYSESWFSREGSMLFAGAFSMLIQASLTNELTDEHAQHALQTVVANSSGSGLAVQALQLLNAKTIAASFRSCWQSPRGLDLAEDIAFETIGLGDKSRLPLVLLAQAMMIRSAFAGTVTEEQEQLLWQLADEGSRRVLQDGTIKQLQMFQLMMAWKGSVGFTGWKGVASSLDEPFRAQVAWLLGHKYARLGRLEAVTFFQTAIKHAPNDSPLKRLAERDLELLESKNGQLVITNDFRKPVSVVVSRDEERVATLDISTDTPREERTLSLPRGSYDIALSNTAGQLQLSSNAVVSSTSSNQESDSMTVRVVLAGTTTLNIDSLWQPHLDSDPIPGIIAQPAKLPGIERWQLYRADHLEGVRGMSWSSDGKWFATGNYDDIVRVYDASELKLVCIFPEHEGYDIRTYFSPDSSWLATSDNRGDLRIWDTKDWSLHSRIHIKGFHPWLSWHPDSDRLAICSGSEAHVIQLDGTRIVTLEHFSSGSTPRWSPDGSMIVSAEYGQQVLRIWNGEDGRLLRTIGNGSDQCRAATWISTETIVSSGTQSLQTWNAKTGEALQHISLPDSNNKYWIEWHPNTETVFAFNRSNPVFRWNPTRPVSEVVRHDMPSANELLAIDPQGRVARGDNTKRIRIYDAEGTITGEIKPTIHDTYYHQTYDLEWNHDGTRLAAAIGSHVYLIDQTRRVLHTLGVNDSTIVDVEWSPDGEQLATAGWDSAVRIWSNTGGHSYELLGHDGGVHTVAWNHDGTKLASGGSDGTVRFWDASGKSLDVWEVGAGHRIRALDWHDDLIAAGNERGDVFIWDEDRTLRLLRNTNEISLENRWSSNGAFVAMTNREALRIFTASGELHAVAKIDGWLMDVAWQGDRHVITADTNGIIQRWNLDGEKLDRLWQHINSAEHFALQPQGNLLAVGGLTGGIEFIDMTENRSLSQAIRYPNGSTAVFSNTGELLEGSLPDDEGFRVLVEDAKGSHKLLTYSEFIEQVERTSGRTIQPLPPETQFNPQRVGQLSDPEIAEASALVRSRQHDNVFWTVSDSGNPANLYAIDRTGKLLATYQIVGVENHDWETIAISSDGKLYLGDVGGNTKRPVRHVYQVREPDVAADAKTDKAIHQLELQRHFELSVSPSELDFEGSFVFEDHLYMISKTNGPDAKLYSVSLSEEKNSQTLAEAADLPDLNFVTGASISADNKRLALVTYSELHTLQLPDDTTITELSKLMPKTTEYEAGFVEAVCWDGDDLLMLSEEGTLYRVDPGSR